MIQLEFDIDRLKPDRNSTETPVMRPKANRNPDYLKIDYPIKRSAVNVANIHPEEVGSAISFRTTRTDRPVNTPKPLYRNGLMKPFGACHDVLG